MADCSIMVLEVEKPKDDDPSSKDRGRLYVCDLAGTEPAGDIFYAEYETVQNSDGTTDHNLIGPHRDQRKTKELQDQGKKINLSLSEMAQFFMKMAQAVKKKSLKPGHTIPGCNSYFLCKYLKDTMVQAKTYLFCAIRPEVTYHKYTYATLGFAKNASVIKLSPKKAVSAASPAERKLMAELAEMKALVAELQAAGGGGGGGGGGAEVEALQKALAEKQAAMASMMAGDDTGAAAEEAKMKQQQEEYAHRGITLSYFAQDTEHCHLVNVDEDPFRSKRFMYIFEEGEYVFGAGGQMRPPGLTVVRDHCTVKAGDPTVIIANKGATFVNGEKVAAGEEKALAHNDRVVLGSEIFLFEVPGGEGEAMEVDEIIDEYQQGMLKAGGAGDDAASAAMAEQMAAFEEEKRKWAEQQAAGGGAPTTDAAKEAQTMLAMEKEIAELMPKTKQLKQICDMFNRDMLTFDVSFQRGSIAGSGMGTPSVKVRVSNHASDEHVFIDPFEFTKGFSVLRDEMQKMRNAIENEREYAIPQQHDPVALLFDNTFFLVRPFAATNAPTHLLLCRVQCTMCNNELNSRCCTDRALLWSSQSSSSTILRLTKRTSCKISPPLDKGHDPRASLRSGGRLLQAQTKKTLASLWRTSSTRRTCSASRGTPSARSRVRSTCRSWSMCATASTTFGISATGRHKHSLRTRLSVKAPASPCWTTSSSTLSTK